MNRMMIGQYLFIGTQVDTSNLTAMQTLNFLVT